MIGRRQLFIVAIAAMVVTVGIPFSVGFAQAVDGQCTEDAAVGGAFVVGGAAIGGPVGAAGGFFAGVGAVAATQITDPCWEETTTLSDDELADLTDNQTYEQALTVIDTRDNEERVIDSVLSKPEFSRNAIWQEAELQFGDAYLTNASESEAIAAGTGVIQNETQNDIANLVYKNHRDVSNAENAYSRLDAINQTGLINVYADGSEVDTSGGVTFSIPDSPTDTDGHETYTLRDGSEIAVASVTVSNTTYTWQDDLAVTMEDPRDASREVPLVGRDLGTEYGAYAFDPEEMGYTPESADYVVARDGSGNTTSLGSLGYNAGGGYTDGKTDKVVYVKEGDYSLSETLRIHGSNHTIVMEPGVTVSGSSFITDAGASSITIIGGDFSSSVTDYGTDGLIKYITATELGVKDAETLEKSIYEPSQSSGLGTVVDSVTHRYDSFTSALVTQQSDLRTELLTEWGDTSSGYANSVWDQLQTDTLAITDIVTYSQMFGESFDAEDTDSQAYYDSQYLQAGMTGHSLDSTVIVEVQSGSTAYANTQLSRPVPIDSAQTYEGHLWTLNPPTSSTWEQNTTYDTADLGGPLYITHYQQVERVTSDGIEVTTEPSTVMVKGEFRLNDIINGDGDSVESIDHGGEPRVDLYEPSSYREAVEQTNERNNEIVKTFMQDGGSGTNGSCTGGFPIIGCIDGLFASFAGIFVAIAAVYILAPRIIASVFAGLLGR